MTSLAPAYRPTGSALHSLRCGVAAAWFSALASLALLHDHPLVLASALVSIGAAASLAGVGRELVRAALLAVPLALLIALVNPLVSREGVTVIVEGPVVPVAGALDITLEALVWGSVAGLRVLVVLALFALWSAAVDPDRLLSLLGRLSLRSALTASLATRMVPLLARDAGRLRDAYALRAARLGADGRLAELRRGAVFTRALAAGALDRAMDAAAALEVRGFALAPRRAPRGARSRWSRNEIAFALAAFATAVLAVVSAVVGAAGFSAYPRLDVSLGLGELLLAGAFPVALLFPFALWARRTS